jgi:ABC-type ATPase with predicted acetyltransferase domain
MYIYNVTINIEDDVHDKWFEWMTKKHIPEMLSLGKFSKAIMSRVVVEEDLGGITYSVQYTTDSKETLKSYYKNEAEQMRLEGARLFQGKFVAFRTELDVVFHETAFSN